MSLAPSWSAGTDPGSGEHDVDFRQTLTYRLKGNAQKGFRLTGKIAVHERFLTEKSLEKDFYMITDASQFDVRKIEAFHNGQKIGKSSVYSYLERDEKMFFGDDQIHVIKLPQTLKVGDSATYNYEIEYTGPYPWPFILVPNLDRVSFFEVSFEHSREDSIDFHIFFTTDTLDYTVSRSDSKETRLVLRNLPEARELPHFAFNDYRALISVDVFESGELVSPTTPERYVAWYAGQTDITPDLDAADGDTLTGLVDPAADNVEKLRIINDFVRRNTRYIAEARHDHAITPFPPSLTLKRGYGDCKDRAALVCALARSAGLEVHMAAVTKSPFNDFGRVHPNLYNHVICAFVDGDTVMFFDPTRKYYPYGAIPDDLIGLDVLILDENQPRTQTLNGAYHLPSFDIAIRAQVDSLDRAGATLILRQQFMSQYLREKESTSSISLNNRLNSFLTQVLYRIKLSDYELQSQDDTTVMLSASADLTGFLVSSSNRTYVPRTPFVVADRDLLERTGDSLPIHLKESQLYRLRLSIADSSVAAMTDSLVLEGPPDSYFRAVMQATAGQGISFYYDFRRMPHRFEGPAKIAYLEMCRQYLENRNNMFIVE